MTTLSTPSAGEVAPDFTLPDPVTGEPVRLRDYQTRDVLLVFFRGTWCGRCRDQMRVLTENHDRLQAAGIATLGVICQSPGPVRKYLLRHEVPFPVLIDADRAVAKLFSVHYWISHEGFNLANPSLFILGPENRVLFCYRGRNQHDLPIPSVIERFVGFLETPRETFAT